MNVINNFKIISNAVTIALQSLDIKCL